MPPVLLLTVTVAAVPSQSNGSTPAEAEPLVAEQTIVLTTEPDFLLGSTPEVIVNIETAAGGPGVGDISLYASCGTISSPRLAPDGTTIATYEPPLQHRPQVAIIAAVARVGDGLYYGWTRLPLVGQGVLEVEAPPGEVVSVTVGDRTYGPFPADGSGIAQVRVEVPPGVAFGIADDVKIPLGTPPALRLLVVPQEPTIELGRQSPMLVHVFAITDSGEPLAGAAIELVTDVGSVGEPTEMAPGIYMARFSAREIVAPDRATLTARLADEIDLESTCELTIAEPGALVAGSTGSTEKEPATLDWPWILAGAGGGLFALAGAGALALDGTLFFTATGSSQDRITMQWVERGLLGVAAAGLIAGAVGGGMALAGGTE